MPQWSITVLMVFSLMVKLFLVPLSSKKITLSMLRSFNGLDFKDKIDFAFVGISGTCNIVLFAVMGPGKASFFIYLLTAISCTCLLILILIEFAIEVNKIGSKDSYGNRTSVISRLRAATHEILMHQISGQFAGTMDPNN